MVIKRKFGIKSKILLAAALVFAMAFFGCDNGTTGERDDENGDTEYSLSITDQQVWWFDMNATLTNPMGSPMKRYFDGTNDTVECFNFDATGTLTSGRFSFTVTDEEVEDAVFQDLLDVIDFSWFWTTAPQAVQDAQALQLMFFTVNGMEQIRRGYRYYDYDSIMGTRDVTHDQVKFIYVDRNITIDFPGYIGTGFFAGEEWVDFTVNLQQGWNYWHVQTTRTDQWVDHGFGFEWEEGAPTRTFDTGNPSNLKWFIEEW